MILIDKMKEMGIAVTPEIEKQFAGDWVTQSEVDRKARKTEKFEPLVSRMPYTAFIPIIMA
jgi:hypothetical protein